MEWHYHKRNLFNTANCLQLEKYLAQFQKKCCVLSIFRRRQSPFPEIVFIEHLYLFSSAEWNNRDIAAICTLLRCQTMLSTPILYHAIFHIWISSASLWVNDHGILCDFFLGIYLKGTFLWSVTNQMQPVWQF